MNFISKKNILAFAGIFLAFSMAISSCIDEPNNNPNPNPEPAPAPAPTPEKVKPAPAFVLKEGNMTNETGVLGMIDENGVYTDSVYYKANGHLLGNVAQDLFIAKNEMFIMTQNGENNGGFAKLFVAEYPSLKEKKVYKNAELKTLEYPSHLVANDKYIYIRDWKGIHRLDRASGEIKFILNTDEAKFTQMLLIDNKVYAITNKSVLLIEDDAVAKTIDYKNPESIIKLGNDKILLMNKELTELAIIDIKTFTITETHDLSSLAIKKGGWYKGYLSLHMNDVFITASSGTSTIYKYNLKTKTGGEFIDLKNVSPDALMLYGGIAVDSKTGAFYAVSIKGYGNDYKTNSLYYWEKTDAPTKDNIKTKVDKYFHFPAGIFPVNNF